jgi:hypothetical protein
LRSPGTQSWIAEWGIGRLDDRPIFFPVRVDDIPITALPGGVALRIIPNGAPTIDLSETQWKTLERTEIQVESGDGKPIRYSGVKLRDVLAAAGALPATEQSSHRMAARTLTLHASDGYIATFAWAELDPAGEGREILLADQADELPLEAEEGPIRVIVPGDAKRSRWLKQLCCVELN